MSKSGQKGKRRPATADRDLSEISAARLQAELARRHRRVRTLIRRHDRLVENAKALSAEIAALGGSTGGILQGTTRGHGRRNDVNLEQTLKRAMSDKSMSVTEAAAALKASYRTTSPSFRQIVDATLIRSGEFERVGRGVTG